MMMQWFAKQHVVTNMPADPFEAEDYETGFKQKGVDHLF